MGWDFRTWNLTICQPTLRLQISPATSDQSSGREKHRDDFKAGDRHSWIFFFRAFGIFSLIGSSSCSSRRLALVD